MKEKLYMVNANGAEHSIFEEGQTVIYLRHLHYVGIVSDCAVLVYQLLFPEHVELIGTI
jgi:hypothetical protein